MPLETGTYIPDLVTTNPASGDGVNQGDSHLRLIKSTLRNTFPNFTDAALNSTQAAIDAAVGGSVTGTLKAGVDGAVGTPSITWASETNSGFYRAASHDIRVTINGVDQAKFLTTGLDILSAGNLLAGGTAIFPLQAANIGSGQVGTAALAASGVTYAKIQNVTTNRLLGNVSGSGAAPQEITIGTGLTVTGTTLSAGAAPPVSDCNNLQIKVATNTTVTCSADAITVVDGSGNWQTLAFPSQALDLGSNGAVNKLDSGTIAIDTWYFVYAIAKADGTKGWLASTSSTAPTMPSGYTFKARMGAVQTIHGTATLYGTLQLGRIASYVVGLAQTTQPLVAANGVTGTYSDTSPTLASLTVAGNGKFVPTTASRINLAVTANWKGNTAANFLVAPSTSYGGANNGMTGSNGMVWPIANRGGILAYYNTWLLLESTAIGVAMDNTGGAIAVMGWEDNI